MDEPKLYPFSHRWTIGKFSLLCSDRFSGHPRIRMKMNVKKKVCIYLYPRGKDENYEDCVSIVSYNVSGRALGSFTNYVR